MSRSTIRASVLVLIVLALTMFAGEGVHELHYANAHPGAYGPADVIALACGAGAVLALAAGIAVLLLTGDDGGGRRIVLVLLIVTAVALGVWLVTLSAASSTSARSRAVATGSRIVSAASVRLDAVTACTTSARPPASWRSPAMISPSNGARLNVARTRLPLALEHSCALEVFQLKR
jgi:hypothetical protein